MARRAASFRQGDVTKALRAASAAGAAVQRVEIAPDGKITVVMGEPEAAAAVTGVNPWLLELEGGKQ